MAAKTPLQQHHAVNRDSLEPSDSALATMDKTLYVRQGSIGSATVNTIKALVTFVILPGIGLGGLSAAESPESARVCGSPSTIDGVGCPLITAIGSGTHADVRKLLENGEEVNCQECNEWMADGRLEVQWGWTPLMVAALTGDAENTRLLLKAGADPGVETSDHLNALTYAMELGYSDVAQLLRDAGAYVPEDYPGPPPDRPHGVKQVQ
jgi:hypothetical protein